MENKPTLLEHLLNEKGYSAIVRRPDGSIAATYDCNTNSWQILATSEEIVSYRNATERALPKMERTALDYQPVVPKFG